jgi:transposase
LEDFDFKSGNGEAIKPFHRYGVGVDTHRDSIYVCVLGNSQGKLVTGERIFCTDWESLVQAGEWARRTVPKITDPAVFPDPLRFTIESTSVYHLPVIKAFKGLPSVVNPVLAGNTKRKTDVLDARALAYQSMAAVWPATHIAGPEIQTLKLMIKNRREHIAFCTSTSNRTSNILLRFGHTIGRTGSVRSPKNRALIEDMCAADFEFEEGLRELPNGCFVCPDGLPAEVKGIIMEKYDLLDKSKGKADELLKDSLAFAEGLAWETESGAIPGRELIKTLASAPGIGEWSAMVWLSEIITPLRFPSAGKLAAYAGLDPSSKTSAGKVTSAARRNGNSSLHHMLTMSAGKLISNHSEPLGQWGLALAKKHAKGGFSKARGAVARRLAESLYIMNRRNAPYSYEKFKYYKISVQGAAVTDMALSTRVRRLLIKSGILDSAQMADKYASAELHGIPGFGPAALAEIRAWIDEHRR